MGPSCISGDCGKYGRKNNQADPIFTQQEEVYRSWAYWSMEFGKINGTTRKAPRGVSSVGNRVTETGSHRTAQRGQRANAALQPSPAAIISTCPLLAPGRTVRWSCAR